MIVFPVTKFDPSEYIFIGEVVDMVGPTQPKHVVGDAWGIVVRLQREVFLPVRPSNNFEVFPYERESDCSLVGWSKEELIKSYPIGTRVRVAGKKEMAVEVTSGNIRLSPSHLRIVRTDLSSKVLAEREYDYETYDRKDYILPDFELRKDLLRLSKTKSEARRIAILERLAYYAPQILDYPGIIRNHLKNEKVAQALEKKWEDRMLKSKE